MRPDHTVDQDWDAYTGTEHDLWRRLYARQAALIPNYACDELSDTLKVLNFGHVPMLFHPVFANYMQAYGRGGIKAHALGAIEMLSRLYWYTVEFGLIDTPR